MKKNWLYLLATITLFLTPLIWLFFIAKYHNAGLPDFAAYSAISRALFEGKNPFPDHFDVLFCRYHWGETVPIDYPGQMIFFILPGYLWSKSIQIIYLILNVAIIYYLIGLTLVKTCNYQWHDLWISGKKQFFYILFCFIYFYSSCSRNTFKFGQIPLLLTFCLYFMFLGPSSFTLQSFLFAFVAATKYSVLTVLAPLLFFKGHWKLCVISFMLFLLLSISPALCGNNLAEIYTDYSKAVQMTFKPGNINYYPSAFPSFCHLGFFKNQVINWIMKALIIGLTLWLLWRERKTKFISDTLMLLAFCLTMLISYHRRYDLVIIYPLFAIRLFDFSKRNQWIHFGITILFPIFLLLPISVMELIVPSWLGGISPKLTSIVCSRDFLQYPHIIPLFPIFTFILTLWSLYLYLHVKEPYQFTISQTNNDNFTSDNSLSTSNNKTNSSDT
ncbi:MAG: DUF2029 domain-containing protein [Victivallales bacterium]|nr:DUF2029 domain-containing protein [Victivallales bacterium]